MFFKKSDLYTIQALEKQVHKLESEIKLLLVLIQDIPALESDFRELSEILHIPNRE